jgi:hypothetical protein
MYVTAKAQINILNIVKYLKKKKVMIQVTFILKTSNELLASSL